MTDQKERIAAAIYRSFRNNIDKAPDRTGYVGSPGFLEDVRIDGEVNLLLAAEAVMQEMARIQMEQATASVTVSQEEIKMLLERE